MLRERELLRKGYGAVARAEWLRQTRERERAALFSISNSIVTLTPMSYCFTGGCSFHGNHSWPYRLASERERGVGCVQRERERWSMDEKWDAWTAMRHWERGVPAYGPVLKDRSH